MKFRRKKKRKRIVNIAPDRVVPIEVRRAVWKRDKGRCVYCRKRPRKRTMLRKAVVLENGHFIAHHLGGDNCIDNIQLECKSCNKKKGIATKSAGFMNRRGVKGCTKNHVRPK